MRQDFLPRLEPRVFGRLQPLLSFTGTAVLMERSVKSRCCFFVIPDGLLEPCP